VAAALVWNAGTFLTKPAPAEFNATPDNVIRIEFASKSGALIKGWLYDIPQPIAQAVLMHGIRSNRGQMIARAEHLQRLGVASLIFDFQAHGESVGEIITLGFLEALDAQAAIQFLTERDRELPRIAIGVSMGGAAAIMSDPPLDIDALIVESVYPDVKTAIANRLRNRISGGQYFTPFLSLQLKPRIGVFADDLAPVKYARNLFTPTLVLSGVNDLHTTKQDTHRLYESFPGSKQLYLFKGAGHNDLEHYDSKQYWDTVEPFILKAIEGAHTSS